MEKTAVIISAIVLSFLCGSVALALDVQYIGIEHSKNYYDGVPEDESPWDFEIYVHGVGITGVHVILPNSNTLDLEDYGDGEWAIELDEFNNETEWLTDYPMGTYTLTFNGGSDSVALVHDEALPGGIANITFPDNNANDVPYDDPVFTWDSCVGLGEELSIHVDGDFAEGIFTANYASDVSSLNVTGLLPARHYYFGMDLDNTTKGDEATVGGDSFWYSSRAGYFNEVEFRTKPIPGDLQADGRVNILDFAIVAQHWLEISGNIFNSNSASITNPLLGLTNVGDSYSMSGYGSLAGAERSYLLTGTETVMGVNCLILRIYGFGEIPRAEYTDIRIAEDFVGNIRVLKVTGFEEGSLFSWQSKTVNFSPILLPSLQTLADDDEDIYPLWDGQYNEFIAFDQTVPLMSTGAGPYTGCVQYNWNTPDDEEPSGIDVDENYICPGFGYVKEAWNDDGIDGWERDPS